MTKAQRALWAYAAEFTPDVAEELIEPIAAQLLDEGETREGGIALNDAKERLDRLQEQHDRRHHANWSRARLRDQKGRK